MGLNITYAWAENYALNRCEWHLNLWSIICQFLSDQTVTFKHNSFFLRDITQSSWNPQTYTLELTFPIKVIFLINIHKTNINHIKQARLITSTSSRKIKFEWIWDDAQFVRMNVNAPPQQIMLLTTLFLLAYFINFTLHLSKITLLIIIIIIHLIHSIVGS